MIVRNTDAYSISSGPAANTLYLQIGASSFSNGSLGAYDLVSQTLTNIGGSIPGNAFGEGRNGFLYSGSGFGFYRIDPATGASTYVGDGNWGYAGDLAVDPLTDILYGAVNGRWGATLVTVDRATGAQTTVGTLGVPGDIWGLGFSGDGTLFAAGPDGNYGGAIYQINKASGAATQVRALNYEPYDMATQPYTVQEDEGGPATDAPAAPGGGEPAPADGRVYYAEDLDGDAPAVRWGGGIQVWEQGAPTAGPRGAASGLRCMATRTRGGYPPFCFDTFETPPLSLAGARHPVLVIRHWYDTEEGRDGGVVRVRSSVGESTLEPAAGYPHRALSGLFGGPGFSGRSRGWVESRFDLSGYAGRPEVRIGFTFGSDGAGERAGWFVDDILVVEAP